MRAIAKTSIQFSLINIPVSLYKGTESKSISFKQVHRDCGGFVKQPKECEKCGDRISNDEIAKGYIYDKDKVLVLEKEEVMDDTSVTNIPIAQFTTLDQIDPRYMNGDVYYLSPQQGGESLFALLLETLNKQNRVAVCRYAHKSKERIGVIRPLAKTLCLIGMRYTDELRTGPAPLDITIDKENLAFMDKLVSKHTKKFKPSDYENEQSERIRQVIEDKLAGKATKKKLVTTIPKEVSIKDTLEAALKEK